MTAIEKKINDRLPFEPDMQAQAADRRVSTLQIFSIGAGKSEWATIVPKMGRTVSVRSRVPAQAGRGIGAERV